MVARRELRKAQTAVDHMMTALGRMLLQLEALQDQLEAVIEMPPPKVKYRYRGDTLAGEPMRPRGRPRLDGLPPGSTEAKRADAKKQRAKLARQKRRAQQRATAL